jgi:AcrR family transcriptional regulator
MNTPAVICMWTKPGKFDRISLGCTSIKDYTVIRSKDTAMIIRKKALQMFRENGYSNITIDDICKAVDVAKSTFFYHYKNKDQLLSSFFDNEYQVTPELFEMIATSDNSWDIFWACISQTIERSIEAGSEIISQIISNDLRDHTDFLITDMARFEKVYVDIIGKGQEGGHFNNTNDSYLLYQSALSLVRGFLVKWCIDRGGFDLLDSIKNSLISLLEVQQDLVRK